MPTSATFINPTASLARTRASIIAETSDPIRSDRSNPSPRDPRHSLEDVSTSLAPVDYYTMRPEPFLDMIRAPVEEKDAEVVASHLFGDATPVSAELNLDEERLKYNNWATAAPEGGSFATWLSMREYVLNGKEKYTHLVDGQPMRLRKAINLHGRLVNFELAYKRLWQDMRTSDQSPPASWYRYEVRDRSSMVRLKENIENGEAGAPYPVNNFLYVESEEAALEQREGQEVPADMIGVTFRFERDDANTGVDITDFVETGHAAYLFPPTTSLQLERIEGDPAQDGHITVVLRETPQTEAQLQANLERPWTSQLGDPHARYNVVDDVELARRNNVAPYKTPMSALADLRDLCRLADCEPKRAAELLLVRHGTRDGVRLGNKLAALIEDPSSGTHAIELARVYMALIGQLLSQHALTPSKALACLLPRKRDDRVPNIANVIAARWSSTAAEELVGLLGNCVEGNPPLRAACMKYLSMPQKNNHPHDLLAKPGDFYKQVKRSHSLRFASDRATKSLLESGLIPWDRELHKIARKIAESERPRSAQASGPAASESAAAHAAPPSASEWLETLMAPHINQRELAWLDESLSGIEGAMPLRSRRRAEAPSEPIKPKPKPKPKPRTRKPGSRDSVTASARSSIASNAGATAETNTDANAKAARASSLDETQAQRVDAADETQARRVDTADETRAQRVDAADGSEQRDDVVRSETRVVASVSQSVEYSVSAAATSVDGVDSEMPKPDPAVPPNQFVSKTDTDQQANALDAYISYLASRVRRIRAGGAVVPGSSTDEELRQIDARLDSLRDFAPAHGGPRRRYEIASLAAALSD